MSNLTQCAIHRKSLGTFSYKGSNPPCPYYIPLRDIWTNDETLVTLRDFLILCDAINRANNPFLYRDARFFRLLTYQALRKIRERLRGDESLLTLVFAQIVGV